MQMVKVAATAGVVFALLDAVWLGLVMSGFYRSQLGSIVRLSSAGGLAPNWPAAILVYVLLGMGVAWFVMPHAATSSAAAGYGALFGLCVYGVYDLTNFSTLAQYPLPITIVDVAWGSFATAVCATVVRAIHGWHA
jgi:uncharacterized membrane protein